MNALLKWLNTNQGGVHPPEHKQESTGTPISVLPIPSTLVLPLRQHVGNLPKVLVHIGERVLKGQLLAEAEGSISAAVHAPTSGIVRAIDEQVIPHPSGLPDVCITIETDGKDEWVSHEGWDWRNVDKSNLIAALRTSGIVGLGGAAFPTQIKLQTNTRAAIHTLVINAAECEPYITCDDMLMRERAQEIVQGIEIARHLLGASRVIIGIEDNKPEAAEAMRKVTTDKGIQVMVVPTLYPSGDARQLIRLLTGLEVAGDRRSTELGVQCFNVATVLALYRFFEFGEPALSRVVTVTGNVAAPANYEVMLGTPVTALLDAAGGALPDTNDYIMGGPMMGFNLPSTSVPVTKAMNCVIASAPKLFPPAPPAMPCIRCTRCADACPVSLQPQELYWFAKSSNLEKAQQYHLFDCIECGCCTYVCPSNIPLVQYYRFAKSEIIAQKRAKESADLARERNEFRLSRIEREKQERAAKHAERAQGAKQEAAKQAERIEKSPALEPNNGADSGAVAVTTDDAQKSAKQAAIAAAIERAKAAKAAAAAKGEAPLNTEPASKAVQQEIAEIDARRKAVGLESPASEPNIDAAPGDAAKVAADAEKQAKIAAAIERAKAMKAAAEAAKAKKTDTKE